MCLWLQRAGAPGSHRPVAGAVGRDGDLLTSATGPIEEALAAPWLALRQVEGTEADAVSQEADSLSSSEESSSETGDADVDAFFAESDTAIRAQVASQSGSKPAGSELAATLLARLLIGAADRPAARVLTDLPLALQGEVLVRIASSTALSVSRRLPVQERPALQALRDALGKGNEFRDREQWGVDRACDVLRALSTPPLRRALGSTAAVDAEVVAVVQSHLFDFNDLTRLRDTELQALLGACGNANLARALFGAAEPVRERILANVSDRRSDLIGDETDLHAEATADEIDLARREILARVRILYEKGTITTYFGSIQTIDDDVDAQEEEGEDEATQETEGDPQEAVSSQSSRRILQKVIIIGVLSGVSIMALVSIVGWLTSSHASSPKRTDPRTDARPQGVSSGRIAVAVETDPSSTTAPASRQLVPGQTIRTPPGVEALLEFPSTTGLTVVDVGEGSTVIGSDRSQDRGQDKQGPAGFYLRVGKVKVSVAGERFVVRTPVGQVHASRGSVFRVRVVLNGAMQAHSVVGPVRVVVGDRQLDLATGKGVSIDVDRSFEYFEPDRP